MESIIAVPYNFLELPILKLRKPSWIKVPSNMFVYSVILASYFLVTGGKLILFCCTFFVYVQYISAYETTLKVQKSPLKIGVVLYNRYKSQTLNSTCRFFHFA